MQLCLPYVDSFFLNVLLYDDEMDFVFDGHQDPGHCVCCLPQRRAEVQKPGHVTQGTQGSQDNPPTCNGDSRAQGQEAVETNTLCRQTLEIKKECKSLGPVFFRYHINRNGHPPEVREYTPSFWHYRGGCSATSHSLLQPQNLAARLLLSTFCLLT